MMLDRRYRTRILFSSFLLLIIVMSLWLGRTQSTWHDVTTARKATQIAIFRIPIVWQVKETRASHLLATCTREFNEEPRWQLIAETSFWQPVSPNFPQHVSCDLFREAVILLEESAMNPAACSTLLELQGMLRENRWEEARQFLQKFKVGATTESVSGSAPSGTHESGQDSTRIRGC